MRIKGIYGYSATVAVSEQGVTCVKETERSSFGDNDLTWVKVLTSELISINTLLSAIESLLDERDERDRGYW